MSISKEHIADPKIRAKVVQLYCNTQQTIAEVARSLPVEASTATCILKEELGLGRFKELKAIRYGNSKRGANNPLYGKRGEASPCWKGDCSDGRGYLTRKVRGRRYFAHHIAACEKLGIPVEEFPKGTVVHHIDGNRVNNNPDNLMILTKSEHSKLHYKQAGMQSGLRKWQHAERT